MKLLLATAALFACAQTAPGPQDGLQDPAQGKQDGKQGGTSQGTQGTGQRKTAEQVLKELLAKEGVTIEKKKGLVRAEGVVTITADFLEFIAIGARGKKHEALVTLKCKGSTLNAALLALGLDTKGAANVDYKPIDPPPTEEEVLVHGKPTVTVIPPKGPRLYLSLSWQDEKKKLQTFAVEDLILDVRADNTIRNAEWIYFGGMKAPLLRNEPPVFIADYEQNYISTYYTKPDGHLITMRHERGRFDDNWWPYEKRLPAAGTACTLILSTQPVVKRLPPLPVPKKKAAEQKAEKKAAEQKAEKKAAEKQAEKKAENKGGQQQDKGKEAGKDR